MPGWGAVLHVLDPRARSINRLAVPIEPRPDFQQNLLLILRDHAVRHGRNIQHVKAALAHRIDQLADDRFRRGDAQPFHVAPTVAADRIVHHPRAGPDPGGRADAHFFEVDDGSYLLRIVVAGGVGIEFRAERNLFAPLSGAVVVISGDAQFQRIKQAEIGAVIEPQHVGPVLVDEFQVAVHPIRQKSGHGGVASIFHVVERSPGGVEEIGAGRLQTLSHIVGGRDEGEILNPVVRDREPEPLLAHRRAQIAHQVPMRTHFFGVERSNGAVPQCEIVVVLPHGHDGARAGFLE